MVSTDKSRDFLFLFCAGSALFTRRQMYQGLDSGTFWDLCFSLPLLVAIAGASTWKLPVQALSEKESVGTRVESWGSLWMSVLLPLVILGVASRLVHEQPLLATIVVVLTLASSGARSLLTHRHEQQTAQAMVEAEKNSGFFSRTIRSPLACTTRPLGSSSKSIGPRPKNMAIHVKNS
jgi:hypothetical protein